MLDYRRFCSANRIPLLDSGHHHCHVGWTQTHCPICAGGREGWHLGWNLSRGGFRCWRCGPLKFWDAIQLLLHCERPAARSAVAQHQIGGSFLVERMKATKAPVTRPRDLKRPPGYGAFYGVHRAYLAGRGFDPDELASRWDLGATGPYGGVWAWRIVIPIANETGRVVAYQGRAIGEGVTPKYKMTDKEKCLQDPDTLIYGLDKVMSDGVIIVEGVPGVWRLGEGAVALFGIDWKRKQANHLRRFKRRYVLFDPEPVAQKRAVALAEYLSIFGGTTEVVSGFQCDPGDFSTGQARRVRLKLGL